MKQVDYIIVGAGLTGLTTAYELKKKGFSILLLEKEARYGGFIQSERRNGFLIEKGPNSGVFSNPHVAELLDELHHSIELEQANDLVKNRFILKEGTWQKLPLNIKDAIWSPLFSTADKFNLLLEPFRPRGKQPDETLATMITRRMGESFLDYAIDPFIGGIYAGDPSKLIPKYALPKMYALEQNHGSLIRTMFAKAFTKKSDRDKRATRAIYSCKGGIDKITTALYNSIDEKDIHLSAEDVKVLPNDSGYEVSFTQNGEPCSVKATQVISTVQGHLVHSIFPSLNDELLTPLANTQYARIVEISLGFNNWCGMELNGFGGLIPFKENRELLGVLFLSSCFKDRAPENGALLTAFVGGVRNDHLCDLSDDEIMAILNRELSELLQLKEFKPDLVHIGRHNKAIPQYDKDHGKRLHCIDTIQKENPGFYILGNGKDGIGMSDRIQQARQFVQSISKKEV